MDASAGKSIRKFLGDAANANCKLIWSSATREFTEDLMRKEMLQSERHAFPSLEAAVRYIEGGITDYLKHINLKWLEVDRMFRMHHNLARFAYDQDPWGGVLLRVTARSCCPWRYCDQIATEAYTTILWNPGDMDAGLFLVHSGRVALFADIPASNAKKGVWDNPVAVYGHGWFLNREFIVGRPTKYYAVALDGGEVFSWSRQQWWKMLKECPILASEIWRAADAQQALDVDRLQMIINTQSGHYQYDRPENVVTAAAKEAQVSPQTDDEEDDGDFAIPYDDQNRVFLPEMFRVLTESLEIAEHFGKFGAYRNDALEPFLLPLLPRAISQNLEVAFKTYALAEKGVSILPIERAMPALKHAGIPRVVVLHCGHKFFTKGQFMSLGHSASMARLPKPLRTKLQDLLTSACKKHSWTSRLEAHHLSFVLRESLHHSFTTELVQELMDDIGHQLDSSEDVFLSICSRLFKWYEQYWNLLLTILQVSAEDDDPALFTFEDLVKLLKTDHTTATEMLWSCDWIDFNAEGERRGKDLHAYDVALCVLLQVAPPSAIQHPRPLLNTGDDEPSAPETEDMKPKRKEAFTDLSKCIANLRNLSDADFDEAMSNFQRYIPEYEGMVEADKVEEISVSDSDDDAERPVIAHGCRQRLHIMLEDPGSSTLATIIFLGMGIMICISILTMLIRPFMEYGRKEKVTQTEKDIWFGFELVLTVIFTVEYLFRISVANAMGTQTTFHFVISPTNICDVLAIIPFYIEVAAGMDAEEFRLLRVVRLLRLTRIAQLARYARRSTLLPPIAMVLLVIWGIYMKAGLSDSK